MSTTTSRASSTSPSCVYLSAEPFFWDVFAGIPRYTARLAMALAAHVPVRFFLGDAEVLTPDSLSWSQDQDLERWGRTISRAERRPLGTPASDCIGLYCLARSPRRTFRYEVNILHDFCATVLPWAFPTDLRDGFVKYLTEHVLESDLVLADSHATKNDATWFSPLDADRIVVAHPGPSLCVETHCHPDPVMRSDRIGLVVSTIEPRKNAAFLLDWFHKTTLLPAAMELWWVGKLGWGLSQADLERMANPDHGRRVRFLKNVNDAELCRLYQMADWSICPSRYEGFGFTILDSLRHGTPVLASCTSSMAEFDHPGVFFFEPNDPSTVDRAWQRLQEAEQFTISRRRLDQLYSWDLVARTILDAWARSRDAHGGGLLQSITSESDKGEPPAPELSGPEWGAPSRSTTPTRMRIGIGPFTVRTASHNRGLGRYVRALVSALLARDHDNSYVLYCTDGLIADQLPTAPNAEIRPLWCDAAHGEVNLAQALNRVIMTNRDAADVFLLLNAPELASSDCLPAKPANGLKVAALIHDLLPLLIRGNSYSSRTEAERMHRDVESLNRLGSYDAFLATSSANREGLLSVFGECSDGVVTIGTAADDRFFVPDRSGTMSALARTLFQKLGIAGPFVLSVGSMEYQRRDNLWGLIEAFAMLPAELRDAHQLVLTYDLSHQARKCASRCAADHGVADRLVLTDRLADKALRILYQRCTAFVSLTSYEELGLPVLEAMHCGAPMVVGNSASQLEVAGDAGLVFNVTDATELGHRLLQVLSEPDRARQLSERALAQANRSRLDEVAGRVLDVLARLQRTTLLALCIFMLGGPAPLEAAGPAAAKPNILVILSDDLGYADVGFQGSKEVPTPHLDALANSGVRCTSGYVTHAFCSPTRAALMTGRYQQRFGHEFNPVYDPLDLTEGLPLTERLLPQFMKEAGYDTGWVGKWHLGSSPAHSPWRRGFDETFGFIGGGHQYVDWRPNGRQYTLPITRNGRPADVKEHLTAAFGREASSFIQRHSSAPWLLYLAFNAPHGPHQPTAQREKRFAGIEPAARRRCLAQISLLDDAVGFVIRALAESGQADRTLVFFLSDNGGPVQVAAKNEPLHGTKGQLYEGGVRVPFVVSWPGHLPGGKTYDPPVSSLDIFATAVALAGVSVPSGKTYDGVNLIPYLAGEKKTSPHDRLFWRTEGGQAHAVRESQWKLVRQKGKPAELFDLNADIGETRDLASVRPELVKRLTEALDAWDKELIPPAFLGSSVKNEDWGPGGANQKRNPNALKKPAAR